MTSIIPNEAVLIESRTARAQYGFRTDVLDKVRAIPFLPDDLHVTTEGVAAYFDADTKTIEKLVERNREELESNGFRVLEGQQLTDMKSVCGIRSRARSLALFDRRALLNVAMLLRDSDVARAVRRHLLDAEHALRELEQTALARRAVGEPLTWTWAEACAIIRQRYGTDYGERTLTRLLRQAGVLRQTGAPKARYKELFWFTGTSWEVHAHAVPELLRRATQVERELRAFAGIQTRLEVEYAAALER